MLRGLGSLLLVPMLVAPLACARDEVPAPHELRGVVLVVLDTLRADHLGTYGYTRHPTSPRLDALAAGGVVFENAIASAPWTLPSVASLLSGRHPGRALDRVLRHSLVESLQTAGISTAAFTEGAYVSEQFGMALGFDTFVEQRGRLAPGGEGSPVAMLRSSGIAATFDAAAQWLTERGDERFFLLVHTYEPHTPYVNREFAQELPAGRLPPRFRLPMLMRVVGHELVLSEEERAYVAALYDGDIRTSDRQVGRLLDTLARRGLDDHVAVIVTSDHGEEMGEHYPHRTASHGHSLRDTLLRVPLVLRDPTRTAARTRVPEQVRVLDVMPTALQLLDVEPPEGVDGRSLLPLLDAPDAGERVAIAGQTRNGPRRVALRTGGYKFIARLPSPPGSAEELVPEPPQRQLYALADDGGEQRNLADAEPERVAALEALVPEAEALFRSDLEALVVEEADAELIERLRSLGYVEEAPAP